MLENARAKIRQADRSFSFATWLENFTLREIVPRPGRLHRLVSLLGLFQRIGLIQFLSRLLPPRLKHMQALLPGIPAASERQRLPAFTAAIGPRRGRVALFEGCIMPELFGRVNEAARLVLARAGYDVVVPATQGCCGALQAHSGALDLAHDLARKNVAVFDPDSDAFDAIVVTSAGCSAALREVGSWLGESGNKVAGAIRDVLEFLDEVGLDIEFSPLEKRICYDDPCHLIHAQGIAGAPRRLLARIPDLELVAHRNAEACCGAAGIYNLTHPEMSKQVLDPKLDALIEAGPELVATANPGCAMQLAGGLAARGLEIDVVHPIELLEVSSRPR
jgi:glycolate oxidase iron-sulfur subunit